MTSPEVNSGPEVTRGKLWEDLEGPEVNPKTCNKQVKSRNNGYFKNLMTKRNVCHHLSGGRPKHLSYGRDMCQNPNGWRPFHVLYNHM